MKIALNMGGQGGTDPRAAQKVLEKDILAAREGDWSAKNNLARVFAPLLTSLAEKRTTDTAQMNRLIEAGKQGLFAAARKYKPGVGPEHFRVFALDFIERSMDDSGHSGESGGARGFFGRLFGR